MAKAGKRFIMVKHVIVTNRDNQALVFKSDELKDNKYASVKDESTTMASLNAVINVLENIPEDSDDLHIILIPKCLGLMLKMDQPAKIRDNGYKTDKGAALTEEFVDLMVYANELRAYLTTQVVRFKIQGSQLLYKNEVEMINTAWKITDKVVKPNYTNKPRQQAGQKVQRPTGLVKPTRPGTMKAPVVEDKQVEFQAIDVNDINFN